MNEEKKKRILARLNGNSSIEISRSINATTVNMGLGICEIKCIRVNVSGSYLSKT
jgi:hypothetical protein